MQKNLRSGLSNRIFSCAALFLFLVGAVPSLLAQAAGNASLQGTVVDSTGAVIPQATVTLTSAATSITRTATTDNGGLYSFPNTSVGTLIHDKSFISLMILNRDGSTGTGNP